MLRKLASPNTNIDVLPCLICSSPVSPSGFSSTMSETSSVLFAGTGNVTTANFVDGAAFDWSIDDTGTCAAVADPVPAPVFLVAAFFVGVVEPVPVPDLAPVLLPVMCEAVPADEPPACWAAWLAC
jgi:hypothetical protein